MFWKGVFFRWVRKTDNMVIDGLQLFSFWCGKCEVYVLWLVIGLKKHLTLHPIRSKIKTNQNLHFFNFVVYAVFLRVLSPKYNTRGKAWIIHLWQIGHPSSDNSSARTSCSHIICLNTEYRVLVFRQAYISHLLCKIGLMLIMFHYIVFKAAWKLCRTEILHRYLGNVK